MITIIAITTITPTIATIRTKMTTTMTMILTSIAQNHNSNDDASKHKQETNNNTSKHDCSGLYGLSSCTIAIIVIIVAFLTKSLKKP